MLLLVFYSPVCNTYIACYCFGTKWLLCSYLQIILYCWRPNERIKRIWT